jgi:integrase
MKDVLKACRHQLARLAWFPHRLGFDLNRLGVDDSVIQRILRHSNVATTQNHYIKTASLNAIAAMKQFSEALMCSACAPDGDPDVQGADR